MVTGEYNTRGDFDRPKRKTLLKCGKCGQDQSNRLDSNIDLQKVILSSYANILCCKCRLMLDAEVKDIARRYLDTTKEGYSFARDFARRHTE